MINFSFFADRQGYNFTLFHVGFIGFSSPKYVDLLSMFNVDLTWFEITIKVTYVYKFEIEILGETISTSALRHLPSLLTYPPLDDFIFHQFRQNCFMVKLKHYEISIKLWVLLKTKINPTVVSWFFYILDIIIK